MSKGRNGLTISTGPPGAADWRKDVTFVTVFLAAYLGAWFLGSLSYIDSQHSILIWPASGVFVAALLLARKGLWPALIAVAAVTQISYDVLVDDATIVFGLAVALAYMLEAVVSALLIQWLAGDKFEHSEFAQILAIVFLAAGVGAATGTIVGALATVSEVSGTGALWSVWLGWWAANASGILVVTPLAIYWLRPIGKSFKGAYGSHSLEIGALFLALIAAAQYVYGAEPEPIGSVLEFPFIGMPIILWMIVRFDSRLVATALLILSVIIVYNIELGRGPFTGLGFAGAQEQFSPQMFLAVRAIMLLVLVAVIGERRSVNVALERERQHAKADLQRSEDKFRAFMENSPSVAFIKDEEGRHLYINQKFTQYLGLSSDKIIGKKDADFLSPGIAERNVIRETEIQKTGERQTYEERLEIDGEEMLFLVSKFPFSSLDGTKYLGGIATDTTAQKRAEEALLQSRETLENAQRIAQIGSWEWNIGSGDLKWSHEVFRMLGMDPESFTPTDAAVMNAVHPEDRDGVEAATARALETGKPYEVDHRIIRPTGEVRQVRSRGEVELAANGSPEWMRGTVQDITDQWRAEQQAREYLDMAGNVMIAIDRDGFITLCNQASCKVLECEAEDVIGKDYFSLFAPEGEREARRAAYQARLESGFSGPLDQDIHVISAKGNPRVLRASISLIQDGTGRTVGNLSSGQDITDQRRTEAELRQAQKMEAVGQLTSGIAHDFNNVLAVVMGNLEMAADAIPESSKARRYLATAMEGAQRGADLNRQLLTFSRRQIFEEKICDVNAVLVSMISIVQRALGGGIKVKTSLSDDACLSRFDPAQLESAILNLAINSRDAMPDGGTLTIETRIIDNKEFPGAVKPEEPQIHIMVGDTGLGMGAAVRERALEPFFTTKDAGEGSGLGLSMVYGFVERSGGRMEIDSHEGEGSQIHLFLPMHDPDIAAAGADGEDVAVGDPANGGTVLLVEDQPEVREVVGNYLEILGYDVVVAADAQEAFKVMAETGGTIQIVLSDMILPGGIDGVEILSRARQFAPDARLILMSGNPAVPALDGAKGLDNIPLLRKPFRKADLARVLGVDLEGA